MPIEKKKIDKWNIEEIEEIEENNIEKALNGMGFIGVGFAKAIPKNSKPADFKYFSHTTQQLTEKSALKDFGLY